MKNELYGLWETRREPQQSVSSICCTPLFIDVFIYVLTEMQDAKSIGTGNTG